MDEFDVLQIVGEGWFGKILLVEHKATDTEMVLKGTQGRMPESSAYADDDGSEVRGRWHSL